MLRDGPPLLKRSMKTDGDQDDMKKLRREVRIMKHNVNMQQTIDNFWSKDQMYAAYHQIERGTCIKPPVSILLGCH